MPETDAEYAARRVAEKKARADRKALERAQKAVRNAASAKRKEAARQEHLGGEARQMRLQREEVARVAVEEELVRKLLTGSKAAFIEALSVMLSCSAKLTAKQMERGEAYHLLKNLVGAVVEWLDGMESPAAVGLHLEIGVEDAVVLDRDLRVLHTRIATDPVAAEMYEGIPMLHDPYFYLLEQSFAEVRAALTARGTMDKGKDLTVCEQRALTGVIEDVD
jgi:hypothetical protein